VFKVLFVKICIKCKIKKSLSEYHKKFDTKDGLRSICKKCRIVERAEYWKKNKEILKEKHKRYCKENKEIVRASKITYRAKKKNAKGKITKSIIKEILKFQDSKCLYCNCDIKNEYHIDHIKPLSKGGNNYRANLCASCPTCNLKKSNKLFWSFVLELHDEYYKELNTGIIYE
jgi:5-methylcytosine-specific restriction endonuclease McrA